MSIGADPGPTDSMLSRRVMRRGSVGFVVLTVAGLAALYWLGLRGHVADVVTGLSGGFFALAVLGMLIDFLLGGLRHHVFLRRLAPGTRLWLPVRADLVGRFTGAVTPSQTGGGPGQIFVLYRSGVPLAAILSTLSVNLLATMVFFVLVGGGATWIVGGNVASTAVRQLVLWGFVVVSGLSVFLALALTRPDLAVKPIAELARKLEGRSGRAAAAAGRIAAVLVDGVERYRLSCARCLRESPVLPAIAVGLTLLLYLNKFTIGWLVVRGLGFEAAYVPTLAVQAVLHLILYAAPTPGGSGIAELSTGALMALLLPPELLAPFALAYRFFQTYLPAMIGAVLLALELRPRSRRTRAPRPVVVGAVMTWLVGAAVAPGSLGAQARVDPSRVTVAPPESVTAIYSPDQAMAVAIRRALEEGSNATSKGDSLVAFDFAVDLASELVRLTPADAESHYLYAAALGHRLELSGTREKIALGQRCREEAERALALDPGHPGAHHVIGRLHAATMRLSPVSRFVARHVLGAEALEGASWATAELHLAEAARLEPSNPRYSMELAQLYIDTRRPESAAGPLRNAATATPSTESERRVVNRARRVLASAGCPGCQAR